MRVRILRRKTREALAHEYEDAAHGLILGVPVAVGVVLGVALVVWLIVWLATASSKAAGDASVTRQHNSGQNQVAQNTKLLGDQATITADVDNIGFLAAHTKTEQDRMDLQGLELNCDSDVATYNADVRNILASGYLPAGLPSSYPDTVCTASTD
jgi:hypothetical protein